MSITRHNTPDQHILIDEKALGELAMSDTPPAGSDEMTEQAEDILAQTLDLDGVDAELLALLASQTGIVAATQVAAPYAHKLFNDGINPGAHDVVGGVDGIVSIDVPLPAIEKSALLDRDELQTELSRPVFSETASHNIEIPDNPLIFLDYQPLARPDNPGGGKGNSGGGNSGGGKGTPGGGRDKGGDNGTDDSGGDSGGDPGGDPSVLTTYTSGLGDVGSGFNIQIDFIGTWTAELQAAFIEAADLISSFIYGDISDVSYQGVIIDDIVITAELSPIDGVGGVLGQAGPTAIRTDSKLPALAQMQFDSADAETYLDAGLWNDIIIHEMLHSIGLGTIWDLLNLVSGDGTNNPLFTGEFANLAYDELFPTLDAQSDLIPVEADGGPGTAYGHWDEATFGNELMTGYINASNDLSAMSIASLEDLGYATTWTSDAPGDTGIGTIVI